MPILKNPKYEKFAQGRVMEGMSEVDAYNAAGFAKRPGTENRGNASNLAKKPIVADRIAELNAEKDEARARLLAAAEARAIEESGIDKANLLAKSEEIYRRCMQSNPVRDRAGNPVMVVNGETGELMAGYAFDATGALGAVNLQAKLTGSIVNRTTIEPSAGLPPERRAGKEIAAALLGEAERTEQQEPPAHGDGAYTHPSPATVQ